MKMLYLGTDFEKAMDIIVNTIGSGTPPEIEGWSPPGFDGEFQTSVWEFDFPNNVILATDGRVIIITEGMEPESEESGDKVTRMKRSHKGKSIDRTLEGQ